MDEVTTQTIDLSQPPPAAVFAPAVVPTPAEFSGKPGDLQADLRLLAAELNPPPVTPAPQAAPTQPETIEASATTPVTVPDKFKAEDGSLDVKKVEKSFASAEETLAKYAEKEKELRKKMYEVNRLSQQPILPSVAPVAPAVNQVPLTQFEIQVANDLINEAAAYGYQMPQGQAIAQARVQVKMAEARHAAEASLTESLRIKLEDQDRRAELNEIAKHDTRVLTEDGFAALSKIRESKPWINISPTPWTEAYNYYLADQVKKSRQTGTVSPTPTGPTVRPPATPVGPTPRAVVQPSGPDLASQAAIDAYVKDLSPEAEAKFWKSKGLRW